MAFMGVTTVWAQSVPESVETQHTLNWLPVSGITIGAHSSVYVCTIENATTKAETGILPWAEIQLDVPRSSTAASVKILDVITEPFEIQEEALIADSDLIEDEFVFHLQTKPHNQETLYILQILPLRKTEHGIEKLIQVHFRYELKPDKQIYSDETPTYVDNSVLNSGQWVKIGITTPGIYRIDRTQLARMGFDASTLDPRRLALYGNGGHMLPESNSSFRYDDLFENAIWVQGEEDGSFDEEDVLYFYGQAPTEWKYSANGNRFQHQINYYSDTTWYFLTLHTDQHGKRISSKRSVKSQPTTNTHIFLDRQYHESDLVNLLHSGREWFGESFSKSEPSKSFDFVFPDRVVERPVTIEMHFAGRSIIENVQFSGYANGQPIFENISMLLLGPNNTTYARDSYQTATILDEDEQIRVSLEMHVESESSKGWLNYIRVNAWRTLKYDDSPLFFRNPEVVGDEQISSFHIEVNESNLMLWDITDPLVPHTLSYTISDGMLKFDDLADALNEYVLFKPSHSHDIQVFKPVANQNLHATTKGEMLIIAHPVFMHHADSLAQMHFEDDGLVSTVINVMDIYNEFGSGSPDLTAIRDFVRMVYYKSDKNLKYLLLFGDASYDFKDRIDANTHFIPSYQAVNSLTETSSYISDDYFGLLDFNEGYNLSGSLDIGIGRFPVSTHTQASAMLNKIRHYLTKGPEQTNEWRNNITFMADDSDDNLHFGQAETLTAYVDAAYKNLNISKVYIDAFKRIQVPGGYRFPQASDKLMQQLENGTLILNYTGHGGVSGLTDEGVFTISHINSLSNYDHLPLFITATCEFSRFDNPALISAGEQLLLNPRGGCVSMLTTTRLAWAHSNFSLNQKIYASLFDPENKQIRRLGDIIRMSKNPSNSNVYNFLLLGDPALRISFPTHTVKITKFNNHTPNQLPDTLAAMSEIVISGIIVDKNDKLLTDFQGYLYPKLFDKKSMYRTLGNDAASYPASFAYYDKLLYRGRVTVKDGSFQIRLTLPRNIAYQIGKARFSFYAVDSLNYTDASGYYDNLLIGGSGTTNTVDTHGPEIQMYINSPDFEDGDQVAADATAFIRLHDPQGIHFLGNDIGRDITLTHISPESTSEHTINQMYVPDLDDFTSGSILYPMHELTHGEHILKIKAWDLHNNSSSKEIYFIVDPESGIQIYNLRNAPNPFTSETNILFTHNKPGELLTIHIDIYNSLGEPVAGLSREIRSIGLHSEPIQVPLSAMSGKQLPAGIYLYRISMTDTYGNTYTANQKMLYLPID
jgi:hypothetical protein